MKGRIERVKGRTSTDAYPADMIGSQDEKPVAAACGLSSLTLTGLLLVLDERKERQGRSWWVRGRSRSD